MVSLRQYTGKQLVAFVRGGDYAHAGETEAIEKVMSAFPKVKQQAILDVGCGLGGTAHFIQQQQWGSVTGIDIEPDSITYAKQHYPAVKFYATDVVNAPTTLVPNSFDIIVLFNAFYAFGDQAAALQALAQLAKPHGQIAIFEYTDPLPAGRTPLYREGDVTETPFKPIKLTQINSLLQQTQWRLTGQLDLSLEYLRWYSQLVEKIKKDEELIKQKFGEGFYNAAYQTYAGLIDAIAQQQLGGTILYAEKC